MAAPLTIDPQILADLWKQQAQQFQENLIMLNAAVNQLQQQVEALTAENQRLTEAAQAPQAASE